MEDNRAYHLDPPTYLRSLMGFLMTLRIDHRISSFLCAKLSAPEQETSHGFLEELELLMSVVSQLLMQAELMSKTGHGYGLLQGLKDCLIFGATSFFSQQRYGLESNSQPISATEKYLRDQTASGILSLGRNLDNQQSLLALE